MKLSKRQKKIRELVDSTRAYSVEDALDLIKAVTPDKAPDKANDEQFAESLDVSVNLGVNPRRSDQNVRGATKLPHGNGKTIRVAVFASDEQADAAREAGADVVGLDELAERVKDGELDFDTVIAARDAMKTVSPLARILGPRGLMPNPKSGTVTDDVASAVRDAKSGQLQFRTDRGGIVHGCVGKVGFEPVHVQENIEALLSDLKRVKPASSKGIYLKKLTLSSTFGPGLAIDLSTLSI
ncbi:MAG: 50S ribosomal protein L1 [Gammaproteobacteria bacterium]|nr:50S ribosomal protein L1 [Gammaproteobacteria bacterium]MCY4278493.1 50S ribosomal protein L1 [Gammaproteobacteria bacterium]